METAIPLLFRFVGYTFFGLVMETIFAMDGIERLVGCPIPRRVPKKYLEGFVTAWMIPLHGLGVLFVMEPFIALIAPVPWPLRILCYAVFLTVAEMVWGFVLDHTIGFFPWDYYALSKYKIGRRGYSLWTLVPMWGFAGFVLEHYVELLQYLSPFVSAYWGYGPG